MSSEKQKYIVQKRLKGKEITDAIFIKDLQNFDNYDNLIEIKIEVNKILAN